MIKKINANSEKVIINFIILLLVIILSSLVSAQPVPLGIDGRVFELDGISEVFSGIPIEIKNLETGELINLSSGKGTSGRYSAALNWEKGTQLSVRAFNPEHEIVRNTSLEGVIHKFDLLLNMTLQNYAPEITSNPMLFATEGEKYVYEMIVFDWNKDIIKYDLLKAPEGMIIYDSGVIEWVPGNGVNEIEEVSIKVHDAEFTNTQNFSILVTLINDPPEIVSNPISQANAFSLYQYEVKVIDPDSEEFQFIIVDGSKDMKFVDNILTWIPTTDSIGMNKISILVADEENLSTTQNFSINVTNKPAIRRIGSISPRGGGREVIDVENLVFSDNPDSKLSSNKQINNILSLNRKEFPVYEVESDKDINQETLWINPANKPENSLNRIVYSYFEIGSKHKDIQEDILIRFKIERNWLIENSLDKNKIVLARLNENVWRDLKTKLIDSDDDYFYYESKSTNLSLFAVTHDSLSRYPVANPNMVEIPQTLVIIGELEFYDEDMKISIRNKETQEEKDVEVIKLGDETYYYQTSMQGDKGDIIEILLNNQVYKEIEFDSDILRQDISIVNPYRNFLTGAVISEIKGDGFVLIMSMLGFIVLLTHFINKKWRKKNE